MNKRVAILAYSGCSLFELSCAVELFALPRPEIKSWYQAQIVSFEQNSLQSTAGVELNNVNRIETFAEFDLVIIPSWFTDLTLQPEYTSSLIKNLVNFSQADRQIAAFCSGAFLLAQTKLINHHHAATHWRYAEQFKRLFPDINYQDNVLYCYDGKFGTSAGSAAGLDLGLAIIRQDFDYKIANQVARRLVVASHRNGGQAQYIEAPVTKNDNLFSNTLDWAISNLDEAISINQLAERACMSRRTFDRKFSAIYNTSAKSWLTQQRLNLAKCLLEDSTDNIEQIANKAGFDNATTMRHHFRKCLAISPIEYRRKFNVDGV